MRGSRQAVGALIGARAVIATAQAQTANDTAPATDAAAPADVLASLVKPDKELAYPSRKAGRRSSRRSRRTWPRGVHHALLVGMPRVPWRLRLRPDLEAAVFGQTTTIHVPCIKIDLKPAP